MHRNLKRVSGAAALTLALALAAGPAHEWEDEILPCASDADCLAPDECQEGLCGPVANAPPGPRPPPEVECSAPDEAAPLVAAGSALDEGASLCVAAPAPFEPLPRVCTAQTLVAMLGASPDSCELQARRLTVPLCEDAPSRPAPADDEAWSAEVSYFDAARVAAPVCAEEGARLWLGEKPSLTIAAVDGAVCAYGEAGSGATLECAAGLGVSVLASW